MAASIPALTGFTVSQSIVGSAPDYTNLEILARLSTRASLEKARAEAQGVAPLSGVRGQETQGPDGSAANIVLNKTKPSNDMGHG